MFESIIKLEGRGAEVLSVVCDGAKPNRSFWKQLGISAKVKDGNSLPIVNKVSLIEELLPHFILISLHTDSASVL